MKIITSGGWSYGNIGDEVILTSTIFLLHKYFEKDNLIFTSYNKNEFMKYYNDKVVFSLHYLLEKEDINIQNYNDVLSNIDYYGLNDYVNMFDQDTLFIMSGGGYFVEDWESQFVSRLLEIAIAKSKGAKVVVIGQSIGPIITRNGMVALKNELNKCDYIAVRDLDTIQLLKDIEVQTKVNYIPDLAVVISDILPSKNRDKNTIGIMPAAYSSYTSISSNKKNKFIEKIKKRFSKPGILYRKEYKKIINELSKNNKIKIILSTQWKWDIDFAKYLIKDVNQEKIDFIYTTNAKELCEQLSKINVLISTKMHPLIVASSYNIPTIGISYNFKVDNYMKMIGREKYCCRIDELKATNILPLVNSNEIDINMDLFKEKVYQMMYQIKEITSNEQRK